MDINTVAVACLRVSDHTSSDLGCVRSEGKGSRGREPRITEDPHTDDEARENGDVLE